MCYSLCKKQNPIVIRLANSKLHHSSFHVIYQRKILLSYVVTSPTKYQVFIKSGVDLLGQTHHKRIKEEREGHLGQRQGPGRGP